MRGDFQYAYWYDSSQRLTNVIDVATSATVTGLGYDVQGNLANKNGQVYRFDFGNRLRDVPNKEKYRYDSLGRRVQSTHASGPRTLFQYNQAGQLLYRHDEAATLATEQIYLGGSLVASRERNLISNVYTTQYQHTDALGSPVAITGQAGQVIDRNYYEPYGAVLGKPAYNGMGFAGHPMDGATGLTYMQQRYYDPQIGRFLSMDPVTANANTGANYNRYWYANNNPYRFTDPDGRDPVDDNPNHRPGPTPVRPIPAPNQPAVPAPSRPTAQSNPPASGATKSNSPKPAARASEVAANPLRGSGWFRPEGHPYVVGRDGHPLVRPGEGIGEFIDDKVPAGHTFGTNHDEFVGWAVKNGMPDTMINIPSMPAVYALSAGQEAVNTPVRVVNAIMGVQIPVPLEHEH